MKPRSNSGRESEPLENAGKNRPDAGPPDYTIPGRIPPRETEKK